MSCKIIELFDKIAVRVFIVAGAEGLEPSSASVLETGVLPITPSTHMAAPTRFELALPA